MLPARQRFKSGDALARQINQRLIVRAHLAFGDGAAQVALDAIALLGLRVHFGVEEARGRLRLLVLGAVKRHIGPAQDLDVIRSVLRKQRDADPDSQMMFEPSGDDRLVDLLDDAQRDAVGVFGARQFAGENGELVAAETRHQVLPARGAAQSHGHVDKHFVTDAMAVQIIDALEGVEVEKQQRMGAVTVRRRRDGILQFAVKAAAVRQSGECILHRKRVRVLLGGDAPRDFAPLQPEEAPGQGQ